MANANIGPRDTSLLHLKDKHIASKICKGEERPILCLYSNVYDLTAWPLSDGQLQLVQRAGLLPLLKWHSFSLDAPLLTAIVERWRSEKNTFHFPCGEMTITLQDVAHILGLRVTGEVVSGCSISKDDARELCNRLLGKVPNRFKCGAIKLRWLEENFSKECTTETKTKVMLQRTRAFLLWLIGKTLFPEPSRSLVSPNFLCLFDNIEFAGEYAWGAAALAFLYRSLSKTCTATAKYIGGSLPLLQVHWEPYKNAMLDDVPDELQQILLDSETAQGSICLFFFYIKEWHTSERCVRQFGIRQSIPANPPHWYRKDARGYVDWRRMYQKEINDWDRWQTEREWFDGPPATHELSVSGDYMDWYERITWMRIQSCTEWTETGDRDRKLQYFQSVIKRVIGVLQPVLCRSDDFGIEEALGDLQNLANMDIDALDVDNEENREHVRSESTPTIQHVYVSKTRAGGRGAGKGDEGTSKGHGGRGAGEGEEKTNRG
ncbi:hypothetical protein HHK36_031722 [Tetracentron sinense]|uniref:Aminotransferase-like plant mobile domain-containing protein n=1 Tax=Tetracentron sinense TaxID=13715 RepID=A0A835D085_TETSI|nr:hypothetical protein HHK36_031722 [Tetracentron sinense]